MGADNILRRCVLEHVLVGGKSVKKDNRGERKRAETEVTVEGKQIMHACKKACTRKETTGRKNNMHVWEEDLMSVGLGFW
jgi:hypothetical protein